MAIDMNMYVYYYITLKNIDHIWTDLLAGYNDHYFHSTR